MKTKSRTVLKEMHQTNLLGDCGVVSGGELERQDMLEMKENCLF